ncbi:hypothetical protein OpiT1DRAFT_04400 [Opitutaceae bacterium TAV1]|nr:hypothetical protein OPIT5_16390 [Opitutaceae bacterium TAV5]EIP99868.1 hypothetical protein OpiT1DRAFT_04400 [Opitutaceae bacterium TAV1]
MSTKEAMLQEMENVPESLIQETYDFLIFLKSRYAVPAVTDYETDSPELEAALLPAVRSRQTAFHAGELRDIAHRIETSSASLK